MANLIKTLITVFILSSIIESCSIIDENKQELNPVISINGSSYYKENILDLLNLMNNDSVSKEISTELINLLIKRTTIINFIDSVNYLLDEIEFKNFCTEAYQKRRKSVLTSLTKDIKITSFEFKNRLKLYGNQVVIDYVCLPDSLEELFYKITNLLESGGTIDDLIASEQTIIENVIDNSAVLCQHSCQPGEFCLPIEKFLNKGLIGEYKFINFKKELNFVKIKYKNRSNEEINIDEILLGLKLQKYYNSSNSFDINIQKKHIINLDKKLLYDLEFLGDAIMDSNQLVQYNEISYSPKAIKDLVRKLPFDSKIFFTNNVTKPHAVSSLISILNNNDYSSQLILGNNFSKIERNNYALGKEKDLMKDIENSNTYPWLFPYLLENFHNVKLNYNLLYDTKLLEDLNIKDDCVSSSKGTCITKKEFCLELDKLSKETKKELICTKNIKKYINYLIEENGLDTKKVYINYPLVYEILLEYVNEINYFNIAEKNNMILNSCEEKKTLLRIDSSNYSIQDIRMIINDLPFKTKYLFKQDYITEFYQWRLIGISNLIQQLLFEEMYISIDPNIRKRTENEIKALHSNCLLISLFKTNHHKESINKIINSYEQASNFQITIDSLQLEKIINSVIHEK